MRRCRDACTSKKPCRIRPLCHLSVSRALLDALKLRKPLPFELGSLCPLQQRPDMCLVQPHSGWCAFALAYRVLLRLVLRLPRRSFLAILHSRRASRSLTSSGAGSSSGASWRSLPLASRSGATAAPRASPERTCGLGGVRSMSMASGASLGTLDGRRSRSVGSRKCEAAAGDRKSTPLLDLPL
jgi:hypothetical protein